MTSRATQAFLALPPASGGHGQGPLFVVAGNILIALAYVATGLAGLKLAFVGSYVTLFWPPSGIAFAAMWLGGTRLVWGVIAGAFAVNAVQMAQLPFAALVALGNALPALVATTYLRSRLAVRRDRPEDPGELQRVMLFILVAALASTTLSATVGTFAVTAAGIGTESLASTWLVWWMGDAMGVLIAAPPILLWRRYATAPSRRDLADALGFGLASVSIIAGLLLLQQPFWAVELCKLFTLLLSLWAAARFGLAGPAAVTLLMAAGSVAVTMVGAGPFKRGNFHDSFALLHSYLFAVSITGMLLAGALADLRRTVRAEKQARAAAERAATDRFHLLTMISHDVRTPLAGMMGALQHFGAALLNPDQRHLADLGLRAGKVLTTLVSDILDVARADAGRIVLKPAPFSPAQSISDVLEILSEPAAEKGITLQATGLSRLPDSVFSDRARFEQVLGNLLGNAVSYTDVGSVSIEVGWHNAAIMPFVMEIRDTGVGIPPDRVANLFDAFVMEPELVNRSTGLGLGLHICRRLVELMGGTIRYTARPSGGSQFRVELPLQAVSPSRPGGQGADDPPRRILVVEDDPIAGTVTEALLAGQGHVVTRVATSEQAIAALGARPQDLVLMDIGIDGNREGGLAAVRRIRALQGPAARCRLVALTANAARDDHARYLAAGLDAVLVKPLDLDRGLAQALADAMTADTIHA
jgi:signal transduction histidine kinase/ActR/RegA family two-component response regulator